ncbi:MAG: pseudouridine synthase [Proteobacteria bacterium]|nr:pseudouridine synthase [Pseudomonadota bacterium]
MVHHPRESGAKSRSGQAENKKSFAGGKSAGPKGASKGQSKGGPKGPAKPVRTERVAKALARAGVASRREVERLINLGKVAVNGRILDTPAVLVSRDDILTVDGEVVNAPEATRLWRYHKPVGLVTTHKDPQDRPTVFQNLPEGLPRVVSVGRLDLNSEGLLLLTNDGDLARALEMPNNGWRRVYRVRALGHATQEKLDRLKDGITVDGVRYGAIEATLEKAKENRTGGANVWITVALNEGKNREVRKVLDALNLKVNRLIRVAYGPFQLGTLEAGAAEEVGPRVIREQLAELIKPESLPTGDKVTTPLSKPGRRPNGSTRAPTVNALADPGRKPSRVRALAEKAESEAQSQRDTRPARGPRRDDGRPSGPRSQGGDRPYRAKGPPREGGGDRPYRPRTDAEQGERSGGGDRSFKPRGPRREGETGGDRPYKARGPRPEGAHGERSGAGDRPYKPRGPRADAERSGSGERSYKPRTPRPGGEGDRPYKPRGPRVEGAEGGARAGGKPAHGKGPRNFGPKMEGRRDDGPRGGFRGGPKAGPGGGRGAPRPGGRPQGKPGGRPQGGPRGPKR